LYRLTFMRKYCSATYAPEMARAIDMWAEAAVYVCARLEVLKLLKKLNGGFCVLPLQEKHILDNIVKAIPVTLSSSNPALVPPVFTSSESHDYHQGTPLSVVAIESLPKSLNSVFRYVYELAAVTEDEDRILESEKAAIEENSGYDNRRRLTNKVAPKKLRLLRSLSPAEAENVARSCIMKCLAWVDGQLNECTQILKDDLDDALQFSSFSCVDWIQQTKEAVEKKKETDKETKK